MDQNSGVKGWQWGVTVIVIIILIVLGYYMFKNGKNPNTTNNEPTIDETTGTPAANVNRVVVSDQFPGNIVYISSVQLAKPGFVAIHKDNAGIPGAIIGHQYFDKGINPGKITLTSPTVEGGIYYAMLHTDDGDKVFNETKDLPVKDAAGNVIMKVFRGSSTVSEVKG